MASKKIDFDRINSVALSNFESLLMQWIPGGTKSGFEYAAKNPNRHDQHVGSFSVNIRTGVWKDFASDDGGSDPVSLFAYLFHNNDQGAAAKDLSELLGVNAAQSAPVPAKTTAKAPRSRWASIRPPQPEPAAHKAHIVRGIPERVWCYRDVDGAALGYIYRFKNSEGGKEIIPLSWCKNELTGAEEWRWMAFSDPRPLYGLDRLADKPDAPVLVVEGEPCADAGANELPHLAVVTWPGGGKAVDKTNWMPLSGRDVIIWPDCDSQREKMPKDAADDYIPPLLSEAKQPGIMAANKIADKCLAMGCRVWIVNIAPPGVNKSGWDIVDAIAEGLSGAALRQFLRGNTRLLASAGCDDGGANNAPSPDSAGASGGLGRALAAWEIGLLRGSRGGVEDCRENVFLILSRHPAWAGVIGWNDFTMRVEKTKPAPTGLPAGEWKGQDDLDTGLWLAQNCDLLLRSENTIVSGVTMVANKNVFHPPRAWLSSLPPWDGVDRLEYFIAECVGCENTRYVQLVGKFFMIGMVARVFRPGCPMQYMPVLEGNQGIGKSSFWRTLGGEWFQETPFRLGGADAYMSLNGAILYEIAEMDSFNKSEATQVKAFITQQVDRYREPYARRHIDRLRQCVFAGTTNHGEYLKDTTGNRRVWPIRAINVDIDLLSQMRPQLFAEALHRFNAGERWHPEREEEKEFFVPEQDERRIVDPWLYPLQEWLEDVQQQHIDEFTVTDLLLGALKVELNKIDGNRGMATRVGNLMAEMDGWTRKRRATGRREWVYVRPAAQSLKRGSVC
jgi:putative DNA primase/helicase